MVQTCHVTEFSLAKTAEYLRIFGNFKICACCKKDLKDKHKSYMYLVPKYAQIICPGTLSIP